MAFAGRQFDRIINLCELDALLYSSFGERNGRRLASRGAEPLYNGEWGRVMDPRKAHRQESFDSVDDV